MFFEKLKKYKVLLASGSKRRHELLKGLEINFEIISQNIDETYPKDLKKQEITNYLVKKKSSYLKKSLKKNELLITADTIVWFNNFPLEKPKDREEAFKMIQSLSNNSHEVISSVCISTNKTQKIINESTKVYFNKLSDDDILYYSSKSDVLDRAGSYGIQDYIGHLGISKIKGSYNNVLGFPTSLFCKTITQMKL
jgi:septum formation protein|tara:strand:+ start:4223 stop:4810 length:588 start_codon:yes stop_codon:yes gene_type:complete